MKSRHDTQYRKLLRMSPVQRAWTRPHYGKRAPLTEQSLEAALIELQHGYAQPGPQYIYYSKVCDPASFAPDGWIA